MAQGARVRVKGEQKSVPAKRPKAEVILSCQAANCSLGEECNHIGLGSCEASFVHTVGHRIWDPGTLYYTAVTVDLKALPQDRMKELRQPGTGQPARRMRWR